jgi:hypothetical protein
MQKNGHLRFIRKNRPHRRPRQGFLLWRLFCDEFERYGLEDLKYDDFIDGMKTIFNKTTPKISPKNQLIFLIIM